MSITQSVYASKDICTQTLGKYLHFKLYYKLLNKHRISETIERVSDLDKEEVRSL